MQASQMALRARQIEDKKQTQKEQPNTQRKQHQHQHQQHQDSRQSSAMLATVAPRIEDVLQKLEAAIQNYHDASSRYQSISSCLQNLRVELASSHKELDTPSYSKLLLDTLHRLQEAAQLLFDRKETNISIQILKECESLTSNKNILLLSSSLDNTNPSEQNHNNSKALTESKALTANLLSCCLRSQGLADKALKSLDDALILLTQYPDNIHSGTLLLNKSTILADMGRHSEALTYSSQAVSQLAQEFEIEMKTSKTQSKDYSMKVEQQSSSSSQNPYPNPNSQLSNPRCQLETTSFLDKATQLAVAYHNLAQHQLHFKQLKASVNNFYSAYSLLTEYQGENHPLAGQFFNSFTAATNEYQKHSSRDSSNSNTYRGATSTATATSTHRDSSAPKKRLNTCHSTNSIESTLDQDISSTNRTLQSCISQSQLMHAQDRQKCIEGIDDYHKTMQRSHKNLYEQLLQSSKQQQQERISVERKKNTKIKILYQNNHQQIYQQEQQQQQQQLLQYTQPLNRCQSQEKADTSDIKESFDKLLQQCPRTARDNSNNNNNTSSSSPRQSWLRRPTPPPPQQQQQQPQPINFLNNPKNSNCTLSNVLAHYKAQKQQTQQQSSSQVQSTIVLKQLNNSMNLNSNSMTASRQQYQQAMIPREIPNQPLNQQKMHGLYTKINFKSSKDSQVRPMSAIDILRRLGNKHDMNSTLKIKQDNSLVKRQGISSSSNNNNNLPSKSSNPRNSTQQAKLFTPNSVTTAAMSMFQQISAHGGMGHKRNISQDTVVVCNTDPDVRSKIAPTDSSFSYSKNDEPLHSMDSQTFRDTLNSFRNKIPLLPCKTERIQTEYSNNTSSSNTTQNNQECESLRNNIIGSCQASKITSMKFLKHRSLHRTPNLQGVIRLQEHISININNTNSINSNIQILKYKQNVQIPPKRVPQNIPSDWIQVNPSVNITLKIISGGSSHGRLAGYFDMRAYVLNICFEEITPSSNNANSITKSSTSTNDCAAVQATTFVQYDYKIQVDCVQMQQSFNYVHNSSVPSYEISSRQGNEGEEGVDNYTKEVEVGEEEAENQNRDPQQDSQRNKQQIKASDLQQPQEKSKENPNGKNQLNDSMIVTMQSVFKALKHIVYIDSEKKSLSVPEIALQTLFIDVFTPMFQQGVQTRIISIKPTKNSNSNASNKRNINTAIPYYSQPQRLSLLCPAAELYALEQNKSLQLLGESFIVISEFIPISLQVNQVPSSTSNQLMKSTSNNINSISATTSTAASPNTLSGFLGVYLNIHTNTMFFVFRAQQPPTDIAHLLQVEPITLDYGQYHESENTRIALNLLVTSLHALWKIDQNRLTYTSNQWSLRNEVEVKKIGIKQLIYQLIQQVDSNLSIIQRQENWVQLYQDNTSNTLHLIEESHESEDESKQSSIKNSFLLQQSSSPNNFDSKQILDFLSKGAIKIQDDAAEQTAQLPDQQSRGQQEQSTLNRVESFYQLEDTLNSVNKTTKKLKQSGNIKVFDRPISKTAQLKAQQQQEAQSNQLSELSLDASFEAEGDVEYFNVHNDQDSQQ